MRLAIPTRYIGEQHVIEDCKRIPTVKDWLLPLPIEPWMVFAAKDMPLTGEPRADWRWHLVGQRLVWMIGLPTVP